MKKILWVLLLIAVLAIPTVLAENETNVNETIDINETVETNQTEVNETPETNETVEVNETIDINETEDEEQEQEDEDEIADEEDEENAGSTVGLFRAFERIGYNIDKFLAGNPEKRARVAAMRYEKLEHKKRVFIEKGMYEEVEDVSEEQEDVQGDIDESLQELEDDADEDVLDDLEEDLAVIEELVQETSNRWNNAKRFLNQEEINSVSEIVDGTKGVMGKINSAKEKVMGAKNGNGPKLTGSNEDNCSNGGDCDGTGQQNLPEKSRGKSNNGKGRNA